MKRVIAVIKPFRLDAVIEALGGIPAGEIQVEEVRGFGRQKGHLELYSGREYDIAFLPKVRVEFQVEDARLDDAVAAVVAEARTGRIGDGKIFVVDAAPGRAA
jgi:nitrogen regulatory protein PII